MLGKIFIFSAPSGAGKTTIVGKILNRVPNCEFSISATTRPARGKEVHGREYYFLTEAEFKEKIAQGDFLEWEEVYSGRFYGSLKSEIDRINNEGRHVVFDVDVKGGVAIKKYYQDRACAIFISPPSLEVLHERLVKRGTEAAAEVERRYSKANEEMAFKDHFDHIIINDDLEAAVAEAQQIVETHIAS